MIIYRTGDVVEAFKKGDIDVLVHGVNCQGEMNSGIAKQIRKEFPIVFERYVDFCADHGDQLLGLVQHVKMPNEFRFILNAFTQNNYGYEGQRFCSYDAIDSVMKNVSKVAPKNRFGGGTRIAMPKIGAGLGGGDWKVIEAIINSHFPDRDIFVYTLEESKSDGRNDNA